VLYRDKLIYSKYAHTYIEYHNCAWIIDLELELHGLYFFYFYFFFEKRGGEEKRRKKKRTSKMHQIPARIAVRLECVRMSAEQQNVAMHNALDLSQVREESEKNAPLILHQRPTKKAAKNGALSDRATRSNTPMQFRHCIGRSDAHTNPRATLAFFFSLHRGDLRSVSYRNLCTLFR